MSYMRKIELVDARRQSLAHFYQITSKYPKEQYVQQELVNKIKKTFGRCYGIEWVIGCFCKKRKFYTRPCSVLFFKMPVR